MIIINLVLRSYCFPVIEILITIWPWKVWVGDQMIMTMMIIMINIAWLVVLSRLLIDDIVLFYLIWCKRRCPSLCSKLGSLQSGKRLSVNFPWKNYQGDWLILVFLGELLPGSISPFSRVQSLIFRCGKSAGSVPERLMVVKPKFLRTRFLFSRDTLKKHNTARSYNSIITFWNERLLIDVSINSIFCDSLVTLPLAACLTASGVMWPAHPPVSFFIVGNFLWKFVDILKNEEKISVTTDSYASKTNTIPATYIK